MGYHKNKIPKGVFGEVSKIDEEYLEFRDAIDNDNPVMALMELSDLIGAIEEFSKKHYNIGMDSLKKMSDTTKSAFEDGTRIDPTVRKKSGYEVPPPRS
jgi:hypothetical protein